MGLPKQRGAPHQSSAPHVPLIVSMISRLASGAGEPTQQHLAWRPWGPLAAGRGPVRFAWHGDSKGPLDPAPGTRGDGPRAPAAPRSQLQPHPTGRAGDRSGPANSGLVGGIRRRAGRGHRDSLSCCDYAAGRDMVAARHLQLCDWPCAALRVGGGGTSRLKCLVAPLLHALLQVPRTRILPFSL